ncbi:MAG TPA: GNAT family N-acetyltransferase [Jatrophihabitans sp.]|jgi:putative acetyltransferase
MRIAVEDPAAEPDVRVLLEEHLADMRANSPACSIHALDLEALRLPAITFWTAREDGVLLGCGALKDHADGAGEVKSMRTTPAARGRGVAAAVLAAIINEARGRGYARLNLETGTQDFFAPAHRLYERNGFELCGPFADYVLDPNSRFFALTL